MPEFTIYLDDDVAALIRRRAEVLGVSAEWVIELAATTVARRQTDDIASTARSGQASTN